MPKARAGELNVVEVSAGDYSAYAASVEEKINEGELPELLRLAKAGDAGLPRLKAYLDALPNLGAAALVCDTDPERGGRAIHYAAWGGSTGVLDELVRRGFELEAADSNGNNTL
jgi:hypothetical protein